MTATALFRAARDLISIESITGNEEPVAIYLEGALRRMGLQPRSQLVEPGRRNLIAGPERPAVFLCTHMDTVPPYTPFREDEKYLYGRGACDTKGIIASMLAAGEKLLAEGVRDFGYLFVVGEETDNVGARAANKTLRAKYIVVGEPTENKVAVGHKGVLRLRVKVHGKACHSAYPEEGDSAVHRLLKGLSRVLAANFGSSAVLGAATVNIGEIEGGVAANVLAPSAEASIFIRVVGDVTEVERTLDSCFADPDTGRRDPRVEFCDVKRVTSSTLERVEGYPETIVSYGTDIPFLADVGNAVLFGPGSILDAHTDSEKIEKHAMLDAVDAYADIVKKLSGGRGSK